MIEKLEIETFEDEKGFIDSKPITQLDFQMKINELIDLCNEMEKKNKQNFDTIFNRVNKIVVKNQLKEFDN